MAFRRVFTGMIAALAIVASSVSGAGAADPLYLRFPQLDEQTEFVDSWGVARPDERTHRGVDLMGSKMAPVVAVLDGVIETMGEGDRSGYHITIDHGEGTSSWYMHLNNDTPGTDDRRGGAEYAFAEGLEVGDIVEAGQVIGFVGDSGNAEWGGAHTHFELHINGRAVNPYPYLRDAWERWLLELAIARGETDFK
ncbi:MAG: M23 family metallopeptidase [Acidimicrobiia bacterium]|nr:M23 family metallopeptidase [Acidimicrobiia bacterium]MDH3397815.1 M23 family metallopeptidase [Acidimicrobiia bacterium]